MGWLARAWINIARRPRRSIILFGVIFILGCAVTAAVSVSNALLNLPGRAQNIPVAVTIGVDLDRFSESLDEVFEYPNITYELLSNIATLPQVESYDFSILTSLIDLDENLLHYAPLLATENEEMPGTHLADSVFLIKGVESTTPLDIVEGHIGITQGRMFTEAELKNHTASIIISEGFARVNSLGIGSRISLSKLAWSSSGSYSDADFMARVDTSIHDVVHQRSFDFEVVGIYGLHTEFNTGDPDWDYYMMVEASNFIYMPNTVARDIDDWFYQNMATLHSDDPWYATFIEGLHNFQNIFVLRNTSEIGDFRELVREISPPFIIVIDPRENATIVNQQLEELENLTAGILAVITIAATSILTLFVVLDIRERKKEIGIYLALGERRGKVISQALIELLIIALIAISASILVGNFFADNLSQSILQSDLEQAISAGLQDPLGGREYFERSLSMIGITPAVVAEEIVLAYDTSLSVSIILVIYTIATATVLLSTIIPMLYILRLNPRKIMM